MSTQLAGIREKIARSRENYRTIESEATQWIVGQLGEVHHNVDTKTGWHVLHLHAMQQPVPLRWPVMLGEIVHNLRSSLDQLVTQLVIANGQEPDDRNQFPIFASVSKPGWTKQDWHDRQGRLKRMLRGLDPSDVATIKAMQPYRRRHAMRLPYIPLETISDFSNLDKHRTLPAVAAVIVPWQTYNVNLTGTPGSRLVDKRVPIGSKVVPVGDTELFAFQVSPPWANVKVDIRDPLKVSVGFGESGWFPHGDILALIGEVERIADFFERRLTALVKARATGGL